MKASKNPLPALSGRKAAYKELLHANQSINNNLLREDHGHLPRRGVGFVHKVSYLTEGNIHIRLLTS